MKIFNQTQNTYLAQDAVLADGIFSRMIGLLKRDSFAPGAALVITRCQQIHMFFMAFAIDVVFVDRANRVVGLVHNIKPFNMSPIFLKADRAIELPSGTIAGTQTSLDDHILFLT